VFIVDSLDTASAKDCMVSFLEYSNPGQY